MILTILIVIALSIYFFRHHRSLRTRLDDHIENIKHVSETLDNNIKATQLKREFMEREVRDWANFQKEMNLRLKKLEALVNIPKGKVSKPVLTVVPPDTEVKSE